MLKNIKHSIVLFWISPLIIALFFQFIFGSRADISVSFFLQNLLFVVILNLIISLFKNTRLFPFAKAITYILFMLSLLIESLYLLLFQSTFSASSIFILLETNLAEAREFIHFYTNTTTIFLSLIMLVYIALYLRKLTNRRYISSYSWNKKYVGTALFFALLFLKFSTLINYNFPYLLSRGIIVYNYERLQLNNLGLQETLGSFTNVHLQEKESSKTFVLVLGESTQRNHLSIYGYDRPTTPFFSELNKELLVFQDVISSNVYTIGALKSALTLYNFEAEIESTIPQLMNEAGFATYWISNQRPVGPYESLVTKIAKASSEYVFTNADIAGAITPYDEVLLPHFKSVLESNEKHKFIVVHLLGTHMKYNNRYPESFHFFDTPSNKDLAKEDNAIINEYDNAIRYQDFVLHQLLELLQQQNQESFLLYFSDHGEEVFTTINFAGHNEENPTPAMYQIPFVLWHSNPKDKWKNYTSRKYSTRHLIHSLADLSGIQFEEWDASKSIFSTEYEEIPRMISGDRNYDEWIFDKK